MKTILSFLVGMLVSFGVKSQSFVGAWEASSRTETGEQIKNIVVFSEGYQVSTWFYEETGKFIKTNGGSWKLDGDTVTERIEFDSDNPDRVGTVVSFKVNINDSTMGVQGMPTVWKRIDKGEPGKLQGSWLMSGRVRNGKTQLRDTSGPRKTMKVLSGTRFQWIAYHTGTRQFMGTGGGTYTTVEGKYSENIEFFSRDDSKAGISLTFDYSLVKGQWHHSGLSSKSNPIYEIWSPRE